MKACQSFAIRISAFHKVLKSGHMATVGKIIPVNNEEALSVQTEIAAKKLLAGGVIAVPTDTIYGIAGFAQNDQAVGRIYKIKKRNPLKPIAISIADVTDVQKWGVLTVPINLLCDLLPGPVTLVFERTSLLNPRLNPDTKLVGIRIPDHKFVRMLAKAIGGPLALTSANVSDQQSTLSIQEFENLWPKLDLICDGGTIESCACSRQGSTVIDLSVPGKFKVLRDGSAYRETLMVLKDKYSLEEVS